MTNLATLPTDITKTIYSICWPETRATLEKLMKEDAVHDMYEQTWTKKQDNYHLTFLETWKNWVKPRVVFNDNKFTHFYPTNGSSEAIREQIVYLHSQNKRLVVFEAEYEGYEAIANGVGMPVLKINRFSSLESIKEQVEKLNSDTDVFFLSEPSSIDGNCWLEVKQFLQILEDKKISYYLDLTYVGITKHIQTLQLDQCQYLDGVFFSLSKIFGVYYHRIGGILLKNFNPLLYGNMWFKNLLSMRYGEELMKSFPIGSFGEKLEEVQRLSIEVVQKKYNVKLIPSDVFLICNTIYEPEKHTWQKELQRSNKNPNLRLCLSPVLETMLKENL